MNLVRGRLALGFVIAAALIFIAAGLVERHARLEAKEQVLKTSWVARVVNDNGGQPAFVEHKWPFGSPENVRLIRVPWGYRHLLFGPSPGAQLTSNGHQPSLEQGYDGFIFWALLPEVTRHDIRSPSLVRSTGEINLLSGEVDPVINSVYPVWDNVGWRSRRSISLLRDLNIGLAYRDIPKVRLEGRFGLNRIGPERTVPDKDYENSPFKPGAPPHNDLWFDGELPGASSTLIVCGSDYLRNGQRDSENFPKSLCHHYFAHDGLNAAVQLTYWKKHHADWREIQQRVTALLDSFKTDIKPEN